MTKTAKINFLDVINHHDLIYAQRIYPSIVFCNKMIDSNYNRNITDKFLETLYVEWNEKDNIFSQDVILKYMKYIPPECMMKNVDMKEVVCFWLSYIMGLKCSSIATKDIYPLLLNMFFSYEGRGFNYSYSPSNDVIDGLINRVDWSPQYMLKGSRIVKKAEDVNAYIEHYLNIPKEKIIKEICYDIFHPDLIYPPDDCTLLLSYLLKMKQYDKWIDVVMGMKLPNFQMEFCKLIKDPYVFVKLYEVLRQRDDLDTEILRYILINEWMHVLVSDKCIYLQPLSDGDFSEEVFNAFAERKKVFEDSLDNCIKECISVFNKNEGVSKLSEWIFSKTKKREINNSSKSYNYVIMKIQEFVANNSEVNELNVEAKDLHYLAFVSRKYKGNAVEKDKVSILLKNIMSLIESDDFYWPSSLEENDMSDMRAIANLFSLNPDIDKIKGTLCKFKVKYEGIGFDRPNNWYKKANKECYVFCVLLLMSEIDSIDRQKRINLYKEITFNLINQCHCCGMDLIVQNIYQISLILAEQIADQILNECKAEFEINIVKNIYAKDVVLKTLSSANQPINPKVVEEICKYKDDSWPIVKQMYLNKMMQNKVNEMELFLTKLCKGER